MVRLIVELDWRASNTCIVRECSVLAEEGVGVSHSTISRVLWILR